MALQSMTNALDTQKIRSNENLKAATNINESVNLNVYRATTMKYVAGCCNKT